MASEESILLELWHSLGSGDGERLASLAALSALLLAGLRGIYGLGKTRGRALGEKSAETCFQEKRKLDEELRRTEERINDAISGSVFARDPNLGDRALLDRPGDYPKVISVFNFKGGVGKTTVALNLAAYFADTSGRAAHQGKRVLLIDLDYQGSMSAPLWELAGEEPDSAVASLFEPDWLPERVMTASSPINHERFRQCRFLGADINLAQREERLKFNWALKRSEDDLRFRVTEFLQSDEGRQFDIVIIDCPPRQTLLTIAALTASTHFLVPAKLDNLSANGIEPLFEITRQFRRLLWPDLQPLGVLPTFSRQEQLNDREKELVARFADSAKRGWGGPVDVLESNLPTREPIARAAGEKFAYFDNQSIGATTSPHELFSRIGAEVAKGLN